MKKLGCIAGVFLIIAFVLIIIFFNFTQSGIMIVNNWKNGLQKADDATRYETRKKVEDTCRSMIASYKTDLATYNQYKDSENEEKQSWAEQAKMRVNKTANTYNEYIRKNSYVWESNVPADIDINLQIIQ